VAPEVVKGERYNESCDVYSFAIVLLAMLEIKPDVLDVFAAALPEIEKVNGGMTWCCIQDPWPQMTWWCIQSTV
jgi:serine/threonine protein kinase